MQRFLKMAAAADVNLDSAFYSATKSKQQFSIATKGDDGGGDGDDGDDGDGDDGGVRHAISSH